jgi:H/ACA ribonucleoprotein complex subunit 4
MANKKHILPSDKKRKHLIKAKAKTNPNYGKKTSDRSIEELLNNGLINLDKPEGPTSHQVDSWIREILGVKKVGHGGTLDPNATGVLPIGVGNATNALKVLLLAGKEYVGIMKLHKDVDEKQIIETCKGFVGQVSQIPPVRSAVKRVKRKRMIYYFDVIEIQNRDVLFRVGCESGTYVRTLCVDIGKKLKSGAHLAELRRTRVGNLKEKDAVNLQDLKDAFIFWKEEKNEDYIRKTILPVESMFDHMSKFVIRDSAVDALCNGANLAIPGIAELDSDIKKGAIVGVFTLKGEVVAIVKSLMSTEEIVQKNKGICAEIERVFMKKGTYPSTWKKS